MLGTMLPFYMEYVIRPGSVPECADGKRAILGLDNWFETKQEMWCKTEAWLGMYVEVGKCTVQCSLMYILLHHFRYGSRLPDCGSDCLNASVVAGTWIAFCSSPSSRIHASFAGNEEIRKVQNMALFQPLHCHHQWSILFHWSRRSQMGNGA